MSIVHIKLNNLMGIVLYSLSTYHKNHKKMFTNQILQYMYNNLINDNLTCIITLPN